MGASPDLSNPGAEGVPFFTPAQNPPAGTALDASTAPTLFRPLRIRGVTLQNRFVVSPMCTYSARDGHATDFHLVHLGQFALSGAALTIVEATAVEARGRISPNCLGLWQDSQVAPLRRIVDFVHSQGGKAGIQLAHAGRKASTLARWVIDGTGANLADEAVGGWPDDVVAPSAIPFAGDYATPKALTLEDIKRLVQGFADAARRAVEAGFDVIEIHGAHGYLITQFLSSLTNVSFYVSLLYSFLRNAYRENRNVRMTTAVALRTGLGSSGRSSRRCVPSSPSPLLCGSASRRRSGWSMRTRSPGISTTASA